MTRKFCQLAALVSVVATLVTGCQVLPPNPALQPQERTITQPATPSIEEQYQAKVKDIARDMSAVCASADLQPYFRQTPCLPMRITEKDLRNKKTVNRYEREAGKKAFERFNALSANMRAWMKTYGTPAMKAEAKRTETQTLPQVEALQREFLKGALLWGEYNRRRLALYRATAQ